VWYLIPPVSYPINFDIYEDLENAEEEPDDTEPADRNIQMEDFSAELYSPSIGAVTKNYL
jgi:hypothetical protein